MFLYDISQKITLHKVEHHNLGNIVSNGSVVDQNISSSGLHTIHCQNLVLVQKHIQFMVLCLSTFSKRNSLGTSCLWVTARHSQSINQVFVYCRKISLLTRTQEGFTIRVRQILELNYRQEKNM